MKVTGLALVFGADWIPAFAGKADVVSLLTADVWKITGGP